MSVLEKVAELLNDSGLIVKEAYRTNRPFAQIEARLPNGALLSVIAGGIAHADQSTVEIAFLSADRSEGVFDTTFSEEWGDDVLGYQTPEQVIEWVARYVREKAKL